MTDETKKKPVKKTVAKKSTKKTTIPDTEAKAEIPVIVEIQSVPGLWHNGEKIH